MDTKRLSFDSNKLRYEIFSMLESNFLFGYEEQKLWIPQLLAGDGNGDCAQKKARRGRVCILSIDGGGMRGVVAGRVLAYLEDALKRKSGDPDARIADYFDVATGTGVGGILTAMLFADDGRGRPLCRAEDTWRTVAENGRSLFRRAGRPLLRRLLRSSGVRFSSRSVENVLRGLFGRLTLRDTLKSVLIPCYDLATAAPLVFSRADAVESDSFDFSLWEVCRATAAAPGFFGPTAMASVDRRTACTAVDGGLVMNNPTAAAVTHVLHNKREFPSVEGVEDLLVLSLGTGQFLPTYDLRAVERWGPSRWAKPVMNIVADGLSDAVDHAISVAFGRHGHNYVRVQAAGGGCAGDVDDPSEGNVRALLKLAESTLQHKSMESLPFGGKRMLPQTNAERLDWFAEQLVLERRSRPSRPFPTVLLKQQPSPRSSLTE